jgi:site-specific recombinase XerD
VNAWLAGVRSFFGWLAETYQIPFDPAAQIRGATRKGTKARHVRQALTDNEVRRLLAQPDRDTTQGKRDYAILATMLYTAARGIEIHRADLADLQTVSGQLVLMVQGKGHTEKDELLVLIGEAETAMRDWLAVRGSVPGALFTSLSNRTHNERLSRRALRDIVKGHFQAAGVHGDNKTTHSLRHTAITSAIRNNAPLEKVRGMTRHVSTDTLMIYYHETDRIDDPAEKYIDYGT